MARAIKQGQHIFIAFQDGEAVLDSQLRPRMYKSREQFEKSFPAWRDGEAELVEYAPTLTPPNEPLTLEELREMDGEPVWCKELKSWALIYTEGGKWEPHLILPDLSPVINFPVKTHNRTYTLYRRPPEGEEETK